MNRNFNLREVQRMYENARTHHPVLSTQKVRSYDLIKDIFREMYPDVIKVKNYTQGF